MNRHLVLYYRCRSVHPLSMLKMLSLLSFGHGSPHPMTTTGL
jgi:hypothetical protein